MRQVKGGAGVATVVAMLAMLAIPSSALAEGSTSLCKVKESPCPAGKLYEAGTSVEGSLKPGTLALLLTAEFKIECKQSNVAMKLLQALASPLKAEATHWDLLKCTLGGLECSSVAVEPTTSLALLREVGFKGAATVGMRVSYHCPGTLECKYSFSEVQFQLLPTFFFEEAAKLRTEQAPLATETLGCLKEMKLDLDYTLTSPSPLYVSS
jgi:hypothetical protein